MTGYTFESHPASLAGLEQLPKVLFGRTAPLAMRQKLRSDCPRLAGGRPPRRPPHAHFGVATATPRRSLRGHYLPSSPATRRRRGSCGGRGGGSSWLLWYAPPFGDLDPRTTQPLFFRTRGGPAAIFQVLSRRLPVSYRASFQARGHGPSFGPCGVSRPMSTRLVGDQPRTAACRAARRRGAPAPRSARARRTGDL